MTTPGSPGTSDRFFKVRPLFSFLNRATDTCRPSNKSVGEVMVAYKGKPAGEPTPLRMASCHDTVQHQRAGAEPMSSVIRYCSETKTASDPP